MALSGARLACKHRLLGSNPEKAPIRYNAMAEAMVVKYAMFKKANTMLSSGVVPRSFGAHLTLFFFFYNSCSSEAGGSSSMRQINFLGLSASTRWGLSNRKAALACAVWFRDTELCAHRRITINVGDMNLARRNRYESDS